MKKDKDINYYMKQLRDLVNKPRKQSLLLLDLDKWNKLCSAMDLIEDTDCAIDFYVDNPFPKDIGEKYLYLYGLLQALFIQQDALKSISESLNIPIGQNTELTKIRDIRNESIGHPTNKKIAPNVYMFNFIAQYSLTKNGFKLMKRLPNNITKYDSIKIPDIIEQQFDILQDLLKVICNKLINEENEFKKMHSKNKVSDLIPKTYQYHITKVHECINNPSYFPTEIGKTHLDILIKCADDFENELKKREIWESSDCSNYVITEIKYPIGELAKYLTDQPDNKLNQQDAKIFLFYIRKQFDDLVEHANDIDKEFSELEDKL
jgi:hypothetical protein